MPKRRGEEAQFAHTSDISARVDRALEVRRAGDVLPFDPVTFEPLARLLTGAVVLHDLGDLRVNPDHFIRQPLLAIPWKHGSMQV